MQVTLAVDEAWSIMMLVVSQVVDNVELSEQGKAALRTWRSDRGAGTRPMIELAAAMNVALGNVVDEQTRKPVRRHR
jgi:hypothetical protein